MADETFIDSNVARTIEPGTLGVFLTCSDSRGLGLRPRRHSFYLVVANDGRDVTIYCNGHAFATSPDWMRGDRILQRPGAP